MNNESQQIVVYWDTSAVLSSLFTDDHSPQAQYWINQDGFHFLSTLTYAETCAVNAQPTWAHIARLVHKWALRGADLWHLALAKGLRDHVPELMLLTFDKQLQDSVRGEGFEVRGVS